MKGYVLLGKMPALKLDNASHINEYLRYCTMSRFADIYYNDIKFDHANIHNGQTEINKPSKKYDFYFMRSAINSESKKRFLSLPSPKFWHGGYDLDIYKNADAIVAITPQHERVLMKRPNHVDEDFWAPPRRTILFRQALPEDFFIKNKTENKESFIIGFSGYVGEKRSPYEILEVFDLLNREHTGGLPWELKYIGKPSQCNIGFLDEMGRGLWKNYVSRKSADYKEMPNMLSEFDVFIDSGFRKADTNGRLGIIEAAACGVPVICGNFKTRIALFGKDYPLMWDRNLEFNSKKKNKVIADLILKLKFDLKFKEEISKYVYDCAKARHHIDVVASEMEKQIRDVIG